MQSITEISNANSLIHLPAKVVMAVTEKPAGAYNIITLEWFMRTSIAPCMYAISIGHSRYSYECLEAVRYFNLVFPSIELKSLVSLSGSTSGRDIDKFVDSQVAHFPGKLHKLPILKDALVNLECEVVSQVRSGDHTIYVGEVQYAWSDPAKNLYHFPMKQ